MKQTKTNVTNKIIKLIVIYFSILNVKVQKNVYVFDTSYSNSDQCQNWYNTALQSTPVFNDNKLKDFFFSLK